MNSRALHPVAWAALWLILVVAALTTRPLLPIDETRYLAVAWEMWTSGDRVVPHLNGLPYSDKPPLLFWLINLGWSVFGVSGTVGRLVSPLFGLASLFGTAVLARLLWPEIVSVRLLAPWVVLGSLVWTAAATLSMFDVMLMFFTLVALTGVAVSARATAALGRLRRSYGWFALGWVLFGIGAGLGALSKGPVILVFTLPVALLAPMWLRLARERGGIGWGSWYLGAVGGVVLGGAIGFGWALPAAAQGGDEYRQAILWGQTSGRLVNSFAHGRPIWWYLPMLLLLLFPWMLWPTLWGSLRHMRWRRDTGLAFCLVWFFGALIGLSLVSGKQPHYFLPAVPAFALIVARAVGAAGRSRSGLPRALPGILVAAAGVAVVAAALWVGTEATVIGRTAIPDGVGTAALWLGLLMVGFGLTTALWHGATPGAQLPVLALQSVAVVVVAHLFVANSAGSVFDLKAAAGQIAQLKGEGRPVAHVGKYHGQYQFLGRIDEPLEVIYGDQIIEWFGENPNGVVVAYHRALPDSDEGPFFRQRFRGRTLGIWSRDAALVDPGIFKR